MQSLIDYFIEVPVRVGSIWRNQEIDEVLIKVIDYNIRNIWACYVDSDISFVISIDEFKSIYEQV